MAANEIQNGHGWEKHWNIPVMVFLFTQDEKTVAKLMSEVQETQEALNRHKADSNVRRKVLIY